MRLLYIASLDFYSKPNPSFHLMQSLLEDTLNSGIDVHLIGCKEEGLDKHIPDILLDNPRFSYNLVSTPKVNKSNFVKRYIEGFKYSWNIRRYVKQVSNEIDVVFVQSSPTVVYTIYFARRILKNKKIIYNVQDMFPGSSIASGVMPKKWMQKIFYRLQKVAYSNSDCIVGISEDMKTKLIEQNVPEDKIKVIVNWFDDKAIKYIPWKNNRFVKKYSLDEKKFYIQYAGTMGYVFDYQIVLDVAEKLLPYKDIVIQMIGEGSQKEAFIKESRERKLTNIKFLPLEPQEMVSDVYSACSVCFIPLKKGIIGNSVPSKAGLLMKCKKPIVTVADANSNYNSMINKNKIGYAYSHEQINELLEVFLKLKDNPQLCLELGQQGYLYGIEEYSRNINMKKYIKLFNNLKNKGV